MAFVRADDRPGARFARAEYERPDPRVHQRTGAHGAGFDGHVEARPGQPIVADPCGRGTQRDDLGVSRRIVTADRLVGALAQHFAIADDDCSDRHLTVACCTRGPLERAPHVTLVHPIQRRPENRQFRKGCA